MPRTGVRIDLTLSGNQGQYVASGLLSILPIVGIGLQPPPVNKPKRPEKGLNAVKEKREPSLSASFLPSFSRLFCCSSSFLFFSVPLELSVV